MAGIMRLFSGCRTAPEQPSLKSQPAQSIEDDWEEVTPEKVKNIELTARPSLDSVPACPSPLVLPMEEPEQTAIVFDSANTAAPLKEDHMAKPTEEPEQQATIHDSAALMAATEEANANKAHEPLPEVRIDTRGSDLTSAVRESHFAVETQPVGLKTRIWNWFQANTDFSGEGVQAFPTPAALARGAAGWTKWTLRTIANATGVKAETVTHVENRADKLADRVSYAARHGFFSTSEDLFGFKAEGQPTERPVNPGFVQMIQRRVAWLTPFVKPAIPVALWMARRIPIGGMVVGAFQQADVSPQTDAAVLGVAVAAAGGGVGTGIQVAAQARGVGLVADGARLTERLLPKALIDGTKTAAKVAAFVPTVLYRAGVEFVADKSDEYEQVHMEDVANAPEATDTRTPLQVVQNHLAGPLQALKSAGINASLSIAEGAVFIAIGSFSIPLGAIAVVLRRNPKYVYSLIGGYMGGRLGFIPGLVAHVAARGLSFTLPTMSGLAGRVMRAVGPHAVC